MLPRAVAESVAALLLGGALVTRGPAGLLRFWDWAIPYLVLFLGLEQVLRRRQAGPAMVFGLGAAFGLLFEGVYRKTVLDAMGFLGIDTAALAAALFDWGMLAVLATHLYSTRFPRRSPDETAGQESSLPAAAALSVLGAVMVLVYLVKTWFGHYIAERALGPTWLVTDILFAGGAVLLARRALDADPDEPSGWAYAGGGLVVWMPGVQTLFTWGESFAWPGAVTFLMGLSWTAAVGVGFRNLWAGRFAVYESRVRVSKIALYAAAWRVVGSLALLAAYAPAPFDENAAAAYAVLVDIPSRAAFCYAFLASRLEV
ncbi:MAG: hypothetical protein SF051_05240 [Elusimicrobiota bacterium]|nr:hypothetical protein [Elusimicrobiota bacterium]